MDRRELLTRAGRATAGLIVLGAGGFGIARAAALDDPRVRRFRSRPDLLPPAPWVVRDAAAAPGCVFYTPMGGPGETGLLILDEAGEPVWFAPGLEGRARLDLSVQSYRGRPVLTWWEGHVGKGYGQGSFVIADETYTEIARVRAGHGQKGDLHEFQLTPDGTAIFLAYSRVRDVVENVVQEVDVASGRVLFEWHSLDHVPVAESFRTAESFGKAGFDYLHANAVDVDVGGDLLLSARHTWTVYKLDRRTGAVRWRLGGRHSDFELGPDARFAWQHDARRHADGTMTIFDNGAEPAVEPRSRVLRLELDERTMRARTLSAWTHPRALLAHAMGNAQLLADGGCFVGWGTAPAASELGPDGFPRFDASFPAGAISYRAYRFPWRGRPAERPRAVLVDGTVYASWNGSTEVAAWAVRSGGRELARARRSGFETAIRVGVAGPPLTVAALGEHGDMLAEARV